jgi:hypothetical protein
MNLASRFPSGVLGREMPISRAFLYISFRPPSKVALPSGSPPRAPIERDFISRALFYCLSKSPVNEPAFQVPQWGPYHTFFSESPVKELCYMFPQQSPCGEMSHLQSQWLTYSSI